jgi:hypothetical protein
LKAFYAIFVVGLMLSLAACSDKPACPAGSISYLPEAAAFPPAALDDGSPLPIEMKIGGRTVQVDQVIHGPLCNASLSGTVYVACDLQIPAWNPEAAPTFLADCDFRVEPGAIVYVAAHNDTAYYQGCSCHTGR